LFAADSGGYSGTYRVIFFFIRVAAIALNAIGDGFRARGASRPEGAVSRS
jgi:hypothetical protein